jgi:acyl carrier protein
MFGEAAVVRPERSFADDPDALGKWMAANAITGLYVRPPLLRLLAADAPPGSLRAVRYLFVENRGDLLSRDVEMVRAATPACRFISVYPSRSDDRPLATYEVPHDWRLDTAPVRVPLGTGLQAAAVGEIAEIRAGGRPTGDLGRRWADGTVEYVGRVGDGVRDALVTGQAGTADTYMAPRTPMEQQLTVMLQDLLSVERVGTHDSFFDLGGFSLLATRLTSRIREEFDVELSLRDLFGSPTVERLAQHIVAVQAENAGADDLAALLAEIETPERVDQER